MSLYSDVALIAVPTRFVAIQSNITRYYIRHNNEGTTLTDNTEILRAICQYDIPFDTSNDSEVSTYMNQVMYLLVCSCLSPLAIVYAFLFFACFIENTVIMKIGHGKYVFKWKEQTFWYFCRKVNILNVNRVRVTIFIFDSRADALVEN